MTHALFPEKIMKILKTTFIEMLKRVKKNPVPKVNETPPT